MSIKYIAMLVASICGLCMVAGFSAAAYHSVIAHNPESSLYFLKIGALFGVVMAFIRFLKIVLPLVWLMLVGLFTLPQVSSHGEELLVKVIDRIPFSYLIPELVNENRLVAVVYVFVYMGWGLCWIWRRFAPTR